MRLEIDKLPPSGNHRNKSFINKSNKLQVVRKRSTQAFYDYVSLLAMQERAKSKRRVMITSACKIEIDMYIKASNRDADNVLKTLLDALQYARVVQDDRFIVDCHYRVHRETESNRIVLEIAEI